MPKPILIQERDSICTVAINRPKKRNSLTPEVLLCLKDIFTGVKTGDDTRVIIIRGAGRKAFCAGVDLRTTESSNETSKLVVEVTKNIIACPCPVIAMIYGYAVGAGCDLAAACDFRIATESAYIGINPVKLGLVYHASSIERFISLIGPAHTKELFITGKFIPAQRAYEMGLLTCIVPDSKLLSTTYSLAREIVANAPLAVSGSKLVINTIAHGTSYLKGNREIQDLVDNVRHSEDAREGKAAFIARRQPKLKGK